MSTVLALRSVDEARDVAAALLASCPDRRVFALRGELGAGKTTLIKALCAELGVVEGTASPSFSIVNEYTGSGGRTIHHFDLYRLKDAGELEGIGFDEYIGSGDHCFIEWPELATRRLPAHTVWIELQAFGRERMVKVDLQPAPRQHAPA